MILSWTRLVDQVHDGVPTEVWVARKFDNVISVLITKDPEGRYISIAQSDPLTGIWCLPFSEYVDSAAIVFNIKGKPFQRKYQYHWDETVGEK